MRNEVTNFLGIDVGSVSINTVVLNNGKIIAEDYTRINEGSVVTVLKVLRKLLEKMPRIVIAGIGTTGSGGQQISELLNGRFVNEIIAQAKSIELFYPDVRTVIDIGGEDSKIILLRYDSTINAIVIDDIAMNTICAAGTGSFLDQQAVRLGVSIEDEFGALALKSENPPRIAGRCSVFAKTDMIHLQQEGTPDYDIVAGLCFALARNFKSNICKGKKFVLPVAFQGGVAANKGMVRAFEEVLGLKEGELIIPEYHASMGAIGAAVLCAGKDESSPESEKFDSLEVSLESLEEYIKKPKHAEGGLLRLDSPSSPAKPVSTGSSGRSSAGYGYVGIDVGSISTNVVVIDEEGELIARRYLWTSGRPIEAVRRGIEEVGKEIGDSVKIAGVGTTGSGRYLIGDFVGADIVKNEITAQAKASVRIDPTVDTIFEIGGQDSKFISLENGAVVDFEMNKVCAAGTGSFLEEQAEKLTISIKNEFGKLALEAGCPVNLGERCTVFMESALLNHQQAMAKKEDLVAGLSYSIAHNYLNRVVGKKRIGENIFFQGAVAFNQGVVAAFEKVVGRKITVPPNNDVTGAIGVALVAMEQSSDWGKSKFRGWKKIVDTHYEVRSFECQDCPNHCEIKEVVIGGRKPFYYGSRCDKYNVDEEKGKAFADVPDLFAEREMFLLGSYSGLNGGNGKTVGMPRALIFHELFPFWKAFFTELGFKVELSAKTNKDIIRRGLDMVVAETCFPVKVAHGHIMDLLDKKVDYIFLPHVINMKQSNQSMEQSFNCPYIQAFSYMANSAIDFDGCGAELLAPVVPFGWGDAVARKALLDFGSRELNKKKRDVNQAISAAYKAQSLFYEKLRKRGKEVLASLPPDKIPICIVSRPYNGCDNGVNLNLPGKLRKLGAFPIPMDYLPLDNVDLSEEWPDMYWRYGQKILSAAEIIRNDKHLQCLYITNFGCGPDSFIMRFFRQKMSGKPYLEIEVDEHSADVGAITRCEAFLDSLENVQTREVLPPRRYKAHVPRKDADRTVYVPHMGDVAFALEAALKAEGINAEVFPESNDETLEFGRKFTCGKECYPCILTTGDMVRITRKTDFDPDKAAFFMPSTSGPCRFGQYNRLQRMVLDDLGFENVPIISPNQARSLQDEMGVYGRSLFRNVWRGIVAVGILNKMVMQTRTYEVSAGETDRMYKACLREVLQAIEVKKSPVDALKNSVEVFRKIKVEGAGEKPIIGIVGEIFVRSNDFANNEIVREIEGLGGEVWRAPVQEWFFHINRTLKTYSRLKGNFRTLVLSAAVDLVQHYDEKKLAHTVDGFLKNAHEPSVAEVWANSERYIPGWFGETALSVGKSVEYVNKGLSGIINVMPFTCLPGTIAAAIFKRFQEDNNGIPCLMMAYDGLEQTNTRTRLEAFMYQAKQYRRIHLVS